MRFTVQYLIGCLFILSVSTVSGEEQPELHDLFFGEALYYADQDNYFDAIVRLDVELGQYYNLDEPELGSFHYHLNQAEFFVGDFELAYRMHRRAGRAIRAVLEGGVDQATRNEAAYRLARILFKKNQPVNALHILERIEGEVPEHIRAGEAFLRGQVYIAVGRFSDAIDVLRKIRGEEGLQGFVGFNLGVALIQQGQEEEGFNELDKVGQISSDDPAVLGIRDKANLVLGYRLLDTGEPERAKIYLERVRLKGPLSNRALLGAGWADALLERHERALVPWTILFKRDPTNEYTQEAMLSVPYAYGKVGAYGKSAILYGHALEKFAQELDRLDASMKSIREGKFLEALVREEAKHDKNWLINLRKLPDSPETRYLMNMMTSHDFQESLKNYRELIDLRKRMQAWLDNIDSYEELVTIRRNYYEPLLPRVEEKFRKLDSRLKLRTEQREHLNARIDRMLVARNPDFLANINERIFLQQIKRMEKKLQSRGQKVSQDAWQRVQRLKGLVLWPIYTEYDKRLTRAYKNLRELDGFIEQLDTQYKSFVHTFHGARQSYEGYEKSLQLMTSRIRQAMERLEMVKARQGRILELMALNELDRSRKRLEEYQIKARFALAESYDKATKAEQEKIKSEQDRMLRENEPVQSQTEGQVVTDKNTAGSTEGRQGEDAIDNAPSGQEFQDGSATDTDRDAQE